MILNLIHFDRLFVLWNRLELSFLDIEFHSEMINEKNILDIEKEVKYKMILFHDFENDLKPISCSLSSIFA